MTAWNEKKKLRIKHFRVRRQFSLLHDIYTSKCTPIYQACGTQDNKHIFQHFLWICGSYCAYVEYKSHTFFFSIKDLDYTVTEDSEYVQEATKTFHQSFSMPPTTLFLPTKVSSKLSSITYVFFYSYEIQSTIIDY